MSARARWSKELLVIDPPMNGHGPDRMVILQPTMRPRRPGQPSARRHSRSPRTGKARTRRPECAGRVVVADPGRDGGCLLCKALLGGEGVWVPGVDVEVHPECLRGQQSSLS